MEGKGGLGVVGLKLEAIAIIIGSVDAGWLLQGLGAAGGRQQQSSWYAAAVQAPRAAIP